MCDKVGVFKHIRNPFSLSLSSAAESRCAPRVQDLWLEAAGGTAHHAAGSITASAPNSHLHTGGPSGSGGFCRGKWWQHDDKRQACILEAKDCLSLQCSEDAADGGWRLPAAVLQRDGANRNIDVRVFKMFLFLNSVKTKTVVTVQASCSTNTLFPQGRYFLFNTDTNGRRLCCSFSFPAHWHTISTTARHRCHQEDLL